VFNNLLKVHSYDAITNLWQFLPEISSMNGNKSVEKLTLFKEHFVVAMSDGKKTSSLKIFDLSL